MTNLFNLIAVLFFVLTCTFATPVFSDEVYDNSNIAIDSSHEKSDRWENKKNQLKNRRSRKKDLWKDRFEKKKEK